MLNAGAFTTSAACSGLHPHFITMFHVSCVALCSLDSLCSAFKGLYCNFIISHTSCFGVPTLFLNAAARSLPPDLQVSSWRDFQKKGGKVGSRLFGFKLRSCKLSVK